jgi:hypothetical protein
MSPEHGRHDAAGNASIGPAHARLRGGQELTERDKVAHLAHSQVAEQRASKQMRRSQIGRGPAGYRPRGPDDLG